MPAEPPLAENPECDLPSAHFNVTERTAEVHVRGRLTTPIPNHQWNEHEPDEHGCLDCVCGEHGHGWHELLDHIDSGGKTRLERKRPELALLIKQMYEIAHLRAEVERLTKERDVLWGMAVAATGLSRERVMDSLMREAPRYLRALESKEGK